MITSDRFVQSLYRPLTAGTAGTFFLENFVIGGTDFSEGGQIFPGHRPLPNVIDRANENLHAIGS